MSVYDEVEDEKKFAPPMLCFVNKTVWTSGRQAPRLGLGVANIRKLR